LMDKKEDK